MSILAWLLGILGVGGAGVGIAMFFGGGPMLLGIGAKMLGFAKGLSPKTWLYIAGAAALVAAFFIHQHHAKKALKNADTAGYNRRAAEDAAALAVLRRRVQTAEANAVKIAQDVRTKNEQEARNTNARADALLLRGPGAARCGRLDHPAFSTGAGGRDAASGSADAAVAAVPDPAGSDLIALPFTGAVNAARQCDLNRTEVLSWREADERQRAELEKLRNAKPAR